MEIKSSVYEKDKLNLNFNEDLNLARMHAYIIIIICSVVFVPCELFFFIYHLFTHFKVFYYIQLFFSFLYARIKLIFAILGIRMI